MSDTSARSALRRDGWMLPLSTAALASGIVLGHHTNHLLPIALCAALGIFCLLVSRKWLRTASWCLLLACVGCVLCYCAEHTSLPPEGSATLTGVIAEDIRVREDGQVRVILRDVVVGENRRIAGAYWTWYLNADDTLPDVLRPGSRVTFKARIYHPQGLTNPEGFDFRGYLLQQNIPAGVYGCENLKEAPSSFSLQTMLAKSRANLDARLRLALGERVGRLASATLLGLRDAMPEEDQAAFRELGIAHVLSVSGYHVGVLAWLLSLLTRRWKAHRRLVTLLTLTILILYALLTGGRPPVVRAVMIWTLLRWSHSRSRAPLPLHLLCFSAMAQLIFSPLQLFSASFQMTYGAMLGLYGIFPALRRTLPREHPLLRRLLTALYISFSAQWGILLPMLYWYGEINPPAVLFNLLLVPLLTGLIALFWIVLLLLPLMPIFTLPGKLTALYAEGLLSLLSSARELPACVLWLRRPGAVFILGFLLASAGLSVYLRRKDRRRLPLLLAGLLLMGTLLLPIPYQGISYVQFDVGNADAAVLHDHDYVTVIDTGETGEEVAGYLHARRLSIDLLVLTHLHSDHAGGLEALLDRDIPIAECVLPLGAEACDVPERVLDLLDRLRATGTRVTYALRQDEFPLPSGNLTVLWPVEGIGHGDANASCLVLLAELDGVRLLLTGDIPQDYGQLATTPADVLKAAHHGSANGTTSDILDLASPSAVLVSCADANRVARVRRISGVPVYATRERGALMLSIQNGTYTIEGFLAP